MEGDAPPAQPQTLTREELQERIHQYNSQREVCTFPEPNTNQSQILIFPSALRCCPNQKATLQSVHGLLPDYEQDHSQRHLHPTCQRFTGSW